MDTSWRKDGEHDFVLLEMTDFNMPLSKEQPKSGRGKMTVCVSVCKWVILWGRGGVMC